MTNTGVEYTSVIRMRHQADLTPPRPVETAMPGQTIPTGSRVAVDGRGMLVFTRPEEDEPADLLSDEAVRLLYGALARTPYLASLPNRSKVRTASDVAAILAGLAETLGAAADEHTRIADALADLRRDIAGARRVLGLPAADEHP